MEKIIFLVVFVVLGYIIHCLSIKASIRVLGEKNKKHAIYNPLWFLRYKKFEQGDRKLCLYGGILQIVMLILVLWGFPKYIFN